MDELISKPLVAVERLAWSKPDGTADIRVGDAADELPFAGFRGSRLESWITLRNEMGEQVGVDLAFDLGNISLKVQKGEVTT